MLKYIILNTFRIFFQNINGIQKRNGNLDISTLLQATLQFEIDLFGWTETNTAWKVPQTTLQAKQQITRAFKHNKFITSTTNIATTKSLYLPGGTAMGITGKAITRITDEESDPLGRWNRITLQGKQNKKVSIFCVYRVCNSNRSGAITTACRQQQILLEKKGITTNPRKQCLLDLETTTKRLQTLDHDIIIMIDANENSSTNSDISNFARDNNLLDITSHQHLEHEQSPPPNTHNRGQQQIDYIFGTANVALHTKDSGITKFNQVYHSDHRGIWLDLDLQGLLNDDISKIKDAPTRGISSKNPEQIQIFQSTLSEQFKHHHIERRVAELTALLKNNPTQNVIQDIINGLDEDITRAMKCATNKTKKIPCTPWSPELIEKKKEIAILLKLRRQKSKENSQQPNNNSANEIATITAQLFQTYIELKEITSKATEKRQKFLEQRVEYFISNKENEKAKHVRNLIRAENRNKTWAKIKHAMGTTKGVITTISVPDPENPNTTKRLFNPLDIANALQTRNKQHFNQAHGTPLTKQEFIHITGTYAENGLESLTAYNSHATQAEKDLLTYIQEFKLAQVSCEITEDEIEQGLKKWKEYTSTSPSGRSLSHYKATLSISKNGEKTQATKIFLKTMATILSACTTMGLSLKRWQRVDNTMLEKNPGDDHIEKVRVIHIIEADYNLVTSILFNKRILKQAEEANVLGNQQWGARKYRGCEEPNVLKQLTYQTIKNSRTTLLTFENDCAAAYDRLVPSFAHLRAQQLGLPRSVSKMMKTTTENTKYYVKTALGTNEDTHYQASPDHPLYGTPQGGKSSPCLYILAMTAATSLMNRHPGTGTLESPDRLKQVKIGQTAFVDDTTNLTNAFTTELNEHNDDHFHNLHKQQFLANLTNTAASYNQYWENLLWVTGGKLELKKCFHHILAWQFDNQGQPHHIQKEQLHQFAIDLTPSHNKTLTKIDLIDTSQPIKTLGVMVSATGCQKGEIEYLQTKTKILTEKIRNFKQINAQEAKLLLHTKCIASVSFSLAATAINQKTLNKILSPLLTTTLPKMGLNRNTPHEIIHSPITLGGLGIKNLYVEQGTRHIKFLVKHLRANTDISTHIQIAFTWNQKQIGFQKSIFEYPEITCPHISPGWFQNTKLFLSEIKGKIIATNLTTIQPRRDNDRPIMEDIIQEFNARQISKNDINKINAVRLFLRIEFLSDMSNTNGNQLQIEKKHNELTVQSIRKQSTGNWPIQTKPDKDTFNLFRKIIRRIYTISNTSNYLKIQFHMGKWLSKHSRNLPCYKTTNEVFIRNPISTEPSWDSYNILPNNKFEPIPRNTTNNPPREHPCEYCMDKTTIYPYRSRQSQITNKSNNVDPYSSPENDDPWHWIDGFPQPNHVIISQFRQDLQTKNKLVCHCYTTQYNNTKTMGCYQKKSTHHNWSESFLLPRPAYGKRISYTSLLGTLYGMFSILKSPTTPTQNNQTTTADVTIVLNNTHIIKTLEWAINDIKHARPNGHTDDYDMVHQIITICNYLEKNYKTIIHFTTRLDYDIEPWESINPNKAAPSSPSHITTSMYWSTQCNFFIDQDNVTKQIEPQIRRAFWQPKINMYWKNKYKWTATTLNQIDFDCIGKCRSSFQKHKFVSQVLSRWLATNKRLHSQGIREQYCEWCDAEEDNEHFFFCNMDNSWRKSFYDKLKKHLVSTTTPLLLQQSILDGFNSILQVLPQQNNQSQTFLAQQNIGWKHAIQGFIPKSWSTTTQDIDYLWNKKFILFIWNCLFEKWQYRCDALHENTDSNLEQCRREDLIYQITNLYEKASDLTTQQCNLIFTMGLEQIHELSTTTLLQWLKISKKLYKDFKLENNINHATS